MFCIVEISVRIPGVMESTRADDCGILAINGCSLLCGRGSLEQGGFSIIRHLMFVGPPSRRKMEVSDEIMPEVAKKENF